MTDETTGSGQNEANADTGSRGKDWTRDALYQIATEAVRDNQRYRRWQTIMRLVMLLLVIVVFFSFATLGSSMSREMIGTYEAHVGVVKVTGIIAPEFESSADNIVENLEDAFANENSVAVLLRINSPGGSPVDAGRVNDAIVRLREEYSDKKIYTVVDEICASGGYYIAAASDEIYADKASVVGSIGVLSSSFGFVELMEKAGIERRLETAGKDKGMLDPFSAVKEGDREHIQGILDDIHQQFIDVVLEGRGEKLQGTEEELFSGLFWTGQQSLELGLVDYLGDSHTLLEQIEEETGRELSLVVYSNIDPWDQFLKNAGLTLANAFKSMGYFSLY